MSTGLMAGRSGVSNPFGKSTALIKGMIPEEVKLLLLSRFNKEGCSESEYVRNLVMFEQFGWMSQFAQLGDSPVRDLPDMIELFRVASGFKTTDEATAYLLLQFFLGEAHVQMMREMSRQVKGQESDI